MKRVHALVLLGWHFLLHWLKKVTFTYRRGGVRRFRANYDPERLLPYSPDERAVLADWQACVGCGICDALCPASALVPEGQAAGMPVLMSAGMRDPTHYPLMADDALEALRCSQCDACAEVCPMDVPIRGVLEMIAAARETPSRD